MAKKLCSNCGEVHPQVVGEYSTNCVTISIWCQGKPWRPSTSDMHSNNISLVVKLTKSPSDREALRHHIWSRFHTLTANITQERKRIFAMDQSKGRLRAEAPVLWLRWTAVDGRHGQTRNETNFATIWEELLDARIGVHDSRIPISWLTLRIPDDG